MAEGLNEHRIYVGGLDPIVDLVLLEKVFSMYGDVCNVSLDERRRSGYVSYRFKREAQNAIDDMDGLSIIGSPTRVEWAFGFPIETSNEYDAQRLAFLRTHPELQLLWQQPQLRYEVLDQIFTNNRRLFMFIVRYVEEFLHVLEEAYGPVNAQSAVAGTSPLSSSLGEARDIEQGLQDLPAKSEPQQRLAPHPGGIQSVNNTPTGSEQLNTIFRSQPEFQNDRQKLLLEAVRRQMSQKNPRALLFFSRDEFGLMSKELKLPQRVVAGTSPLGSSLGEARDIERATAASTSVTSRISHLQSEPDPMAEFVDRNGATNAQGTEVKKKVKRRTKKRNEVKRSFEVTKVDKKVEEPKTVDLPCKICLDEQVGVVFLPCGHLVSCPTCAQRISNCPMCRIHITGKVKTYLS